VGQYDCNGYTWGAEIWDFTESGEIQPGESYQCVVIGADGKGSVLGHCSGEAAKWSVHEPATYIVNRGTGQCLGASGSSYQLQVGACDGSSQQQWYQGVPDGRNLKNKATGKCMDLLHDDQILGNTVGQYDCNGYTWGAEIWDVTESGEIQPGESYSCVVIGADGKGSVLGECNGDAASWSLQGHLPPRAAGGEALADASQKTRRVSSESLLVLGLIVATFAAILLVVMPRKRSSDGKISEPLLVG